MYKEIYIQTSGIKVKNVVICNFYFKDVDMDDTANYITIYDKDGRMQFKCHVNKIVEFIRIDNRSELIIDQMKVPFHKKEVK